MRLRDVLLDLALPADCAGCGSSPGPVCRCCAAVLEAPARPHAPTPVPMGFPPTWVVTAYDGVCRELLLGVKERGALGAIRPLGAALARAVTAALAQQPPADAAGAPVLLVPVPSSRAAIRARGDDVVLELTRRAATAARASGLRVRAVPALRHQRRVADSAGLTADRRALNLAGALAARPVARGLLAGAAVVLTDDLVTTGASLSEAARACRSAGATVLAAATVAATQRRRRPVTSGVFGTSVLDTSRPPEAHPWRSS